MHDPTHSVPSKLVCSIIAGLCLWLSCFSSSLASVDICRQPLAYSFLSIAYNEQAKSSFEPEIGRTTQENTNFDLLLKLRDDWAFGAGHRYKILDVEPLELQTNGHLHTYFFALHRQRQSAGRGFRFSIAPALSASSNVIKRPGEYETDVLQVLAALLWSRQLSDRMSLRYGVCGDHRFGSYQIYPSVSIEMRPSADWIFELGFPTSQLTRKVSGNFSSSLRIAPDGNEWYVRDKGLEKESHVVYEAWTLEWAVNWRASKHFVLSAGIGRQLRNRYEMTLLDDSRVRLRSDPVTRISASLAWRF